MKQLIRKFLMIGIAFCMSSLSYTMSNELLLRRTEKALIDGVPSAFSRYDVPPRFPHSFVDHVREKMLGHLLKLPRFQDKAAQDLLRKRLHHGFVSQDILTICRNFNFEGPENFNWVKKYIHNKMHKKRIVRGDFAAPTTLDEWYDIEDKALNDITTDIKNIVPQLNNLPLWAKIKFWFLDLSPRKKYAYAGTFAAAASYAIYRLISAGYYYYIYNYE